MHMHTELPQEILRMMTEEEGATALEYAFIISLASIAIGAVIPDLRAQIDDLFLRTASGIGAAAADAQTP